MDPNNPDRPRPKFDPQTGQPLSMEGGSGEDAPYTPPPSPPSDAGIPENARVAAGGTISSPMPAPPPAQEPILSDPTPDAPVPADNPPPPPATPGSQYIPPQEYSAPAPQGQPQYVPQQYQQQPPTEPYQYPPYPPQQPPAQSPGYPPQQPPPATNVNAPQKRSNSLPLVLGALALLLVAAAVGTYFLLTRAGIVGSNNVAIERALPSNTLGYFSFDPNPSDAQKRAFTNMREAFESQTGFDDIVDQMTSGMKEMSGSAASCLPAPEGEGIDAFDDYLGESITIAMLSPGTNDLDAIRAGSSEIAPVMGRNVVGLIDLDFNPLNKKGPLKDIKAIADQKTETVESYNGTDIRKYSCEDVTLYFGLLGDTNTAAVGVDTAPVKRVIDEYKANKGLKDDPTYKYLSGKVPADHVAAFYINLTETMRQVQLAVPPDVLGTMGAAAEMYDSTGGVLMTVSGQDDGLQIDFATEIKSEALSVTSSAARPDAATIRDIPTEALGFFLMTDLKTAILSAMDAVEKQSPEAAEQIREVEQQVLEATGLDLRDDIISLLGGDAAISVSRFDARDGMSPPVVFQLKLNGADREKAAANLDKVIRRLEDAVETEKFDAAGGTFYSLGQDQGIIGVSSDRLMYVIRPGADSRALLDEVVAGFGKGLGDTDKWKDVQKHLPADSNAIFYVDITGIREMAEEAMDEEARASYQEDGAPFIKPLKYVVSGSAGEAIKEGEPARGVTRIFIGIGK